MISPTRAAAAPQRASPPLPAAAQHAQPVASTSAHTLDAAPPPPQGVFAASPRPAPSPALPAPAAAEPQSQADADAAADAAAEEAIARMGLSPADASLLASLSASDHNAAVELLAALGAQIKPEPGDDQQALHPYDGAAGAPAGDSEGDGMRDLAALTGIPIASVWSNSAPPSLAAHSMHSTPQPFSRPRSPDPRPDSEPPFHSFWNTPPPFAHPLAPDTAAPAAYEAVPASLGELAPEVKAPTPPREASPGPIAAYAKLEFPGFSYYLQTLSVSIGRRPAHIAGPEPGAEKHTHLTGLDRVDGDVDVDLGPLKSISRLHARIFYRSAAEVPWDAWSLAPREEASFVFQVLGRNGAFVDDVFVGKDGMLPLGKR